MNGILVGLGRQSRGWVQDCRKHPGVDLVGFVDISPAAREQFVADGLAAKEQVFESLAEAIDACDAQFVLDVTPPAAHKPVALAAIGAGLHVLGEKPMCETLADARAVAEAGEQAGVRHMITQNFRFGPLPRTTRRLIRDGAIGRPGQLDISFYVPWADRPDTHYVTEPFMFLTDMGVHHFDMMRYVLDADPSAVRTLSWNQPWGWHKGDACHVAVFDFASGLKGVHMAMGCSLGRQTPANGQWRIEGPEGSITWEDDRIFISREHRTEAKRRDEIPPDALPAVGRQAMLDEFVAAVREGREPECGARDNLRSLAMTLGAVASAATGQRVDLVY